MSARIIVAGDCDAITSRFVERQRRWRSLVQRIYPRHAEVEPHAPLLLAWMFDRAQRLPGSPMREYALEAGDGGRVRLNADPSAHRPWCWIGARRDGAHQTWLDGRGLYELWAWRFDCPVATAAEEIWLVIRCGGARVDDGR